MIVAYGALAPIHDASSLIRGDISLMRSELRRNAISHILICICATFVCAVANAETIDADAVLMSRFRDKISNRKKDEKNVSLLIAAMFGNKIRIRNLRMLSNEIKFSDIKESPLPDQIEFRKSTFVNCTDSPKNEEVTLTIEVRELSSINITNSITTASKFGFDIALPLEKLSKLTGAFDRTVNFTDLRSQSNEKKRTEVRRESILKPPMKKYIIELRVDYRKDALTFGGNITADGEVYIPTDGGEGIILGRVSQYLTLQERTFDISGEMWNVGAIDITQIYTEEPLTLESKECVNDH